jgi:VTC domain
MHSGEISTALSSLNPIGLESIGSVRFMNRIDTKFVFSVRKVVDLIDIMYGKYKVLEIGNIRTLPYHTTYMDTPDYLFYNQHVRGELERHKIRYRKYEFTNESFLEIKKKTNKRRTIKWRIENQFISGSFDDPAVNFIKEHLTINSMIVKPVLINRFTRTTLIGLDSKERITIDYNITFLETTNGDQTQMPYLAIVELKKEGYSHCSSFNNLIKQLNIYPTGFSKYCTGNAILNDRLRKNMIKPTLLLLNKIENEYIRSHSN